MDDLTREVGKKATKKAISRGISVDGKGGYARHVLLCIGEGCCEGADHQDTMRRLNKRLNHLKKADFTSTGRGSDA